MFRVEILIDREWQQASLHTKREDALRQKEIFMQQNNLEGHLVRVLPGEAYGSKETRS